MGAGAVERVGHHDVEIEHRPAAEAQHHVAAAQAVRPSADTTRKDEQTGTACGVGQRCQLGPAQHKRVDLRQKAARETLALGGQDGADTLRLEQRRVPARAEAVERERVGRKGHRGAHRNRMAEAALVKSQSVNPRTEQAVGQT